MNAKAAGSVTSVLSRQERLSNCVQSLTGKPGFPAFSRHIQAILAAIDKDEVSVPELTRLIIRDYSLSLSLLRRANSCNFSGRRILSVTHAVVMLGTEAVRHLAAGLLIFEHFHNKPAGVRELMTLSMLSANHVREIARRLPDVQPEEAYLCGMVRNLGEVLAAYYLPAEYARILKVAESGHRTLSAACQEVLQFTFEDLGEAVARYWGMPERVAECQRATAFSGTPGNPRDLLLDAVSLGDLMTTAAYRMEPQAGAARLRLCFEDHYPRLRLGREEVDEILSAAIGQTRESFAAMGVRIDELRLRAQTREVLEAMSEAPVCLEEGPANASSSADDDSLERLSFEICRLLDSGSEFDLNTLILMVLEAIYRGAAFERAIFAFVNQDRTRIEGRIGLGDEVNALLNRFRFRMSARGGPVSAALLSQRSVLVDASHDNTNALARVFGCTWLGLYPVVVAGQVVGCIYMESHAMPPRLKDGDLRFLNKLRDSLVSAIGRLRHDP